MSAAKLEKKIWTLEQRLREEFRVELQRALGQCLAKLGRFLRRVVGLRRLDYFLEKKRRC